MNKKQNSGFTYLMTLAAVAILAIFVQIATPLNSRIIQVDKEAELLFRGLAYRKAIESYYLAGKSFRTYPRQLDDLLQDPRFVYKRHLRKQYLEPFNNDEWIILPSDDGGIRGVLSTSNLTPLKQRGFPASLFHFENAKSYKDWKFEYLPPVVN